MAIAMPLNTNGTALDGVGGRQLRKRRRDEIWGLTAGGSKVEIDAPDCGQTEERRAEGKIDSRASRHEPSGAEVDQHGAKRHPEHGNRDGDECQMRKQGHAENPCQEDFQHQGGHCHEEDAGILEPAGVHGCQRTGLASAVQRFGRAEVSTIGVVGL
jgi:hypothetical protein